MKPEHSAETQQFDAAELGAIMREMRENLGHDLVSVASDLRIRLVYLEAIESGRLADLPGGVYVTGFLRAYSDFLGLDGEEVVRRFRMAGVGTSNQSQLHLPSPVEEGRLPTGPILLLAAIVAAVAYGGWHYFSASDNNPVDRIASVPAEFFRMLGTDSDSSPAAVPASSAPNTDSASAPSVEMQLGGLSSEKAPPAEASSEMTLEPSADTTDAAKAPKTQSAPAEIPVAPEPAESERLAAPAVPVEPVRPAALLETGSMKAASLEMPPAAPKPAAETLDQNSPPSPVPRAESASVTLVPTGGFQLPGAKKIVVQATADSFVAVLMNNSQRLFSQLMRAGDSFEAPSGAGLTLETGNAGALEIWIDGRRIPSLGTVGEIRRNISLDAEKLLDGIN